jgi:hypothetical protein
MLSDAKLSNLDARQLIGAVITLGFADSYFCRDAVVSLPSCLRYLTIPVAIAFAI